MPAQQLLPGVVTHRLGEPRRVHDVGEQEGPQRSRRRLGSWRNDVEVDHGADLLQSSAAALISRRAPASSPSAVSARASRTRASAASYGASTSHQVRTPSRSEAIAASVSPRWSAVRRVPPTLQPPARASQPARQLVELGDAHVRRGLVAHREAGPHVHRKHEHPSLSSEQALRPEPGRGSALPRARRPGPAASGLAPAGRRHRTPRPPRAPPRRQPGHHDEPGCPPARYSPTRRCNGSPPAAPRTPAARVPPPEPADHGGDRSPPGGSDTARCSR